MPCFRERLHAPLTWWLLAIPVIVLLGGQLYAGLGSFGDLPGEVGFAAFAVVYLAGLLALSVARIEVREGHLTAGRRTLSLAHVDAAVVLDERQFARLRGPGADPAAHQVLRPYLKQGVYLSICDPSGGAPYWLIGTRRPAELVAAIERCRAGDHPQSAATG